MQANEMAADPTGPPDESGQVVASRKSKKRSFQKQKSQRNIGAIQARSARKKLTSTRDRPIYLVIQNFVLNIGEITVTKKGDDIRISRSQVGVVGKGARARDIRQIQQNVSATDLAGLSKDLGKLLVALKKHAVTPEQDADIDIIQSAKEAAAKGEERKTTSLLGKVGGWVLDQAGKIGVPIATEALKRALGI